MEEFLRRAARETQVSFRDLFVMFDALPIPLSWGTFPNGGIRFVNRAFTRTFGYAADAFCAVEQWLNAVYETEFERLAIAEYRSRLYVRDETGISEVGPFECRIRCADGSFQTVLNREVVLWDLGLGLTTFENISRQKATEESIRRIALEDPLTGLGNRRSIDEIWNSVFNAGKSIPSGISAVIVADLDNFKPVNDQFGHDVGDELLKVIASKLKSAIRDTDFVARTGGDEFAVFLPRLHDTLQVEAVCQRIVDAVAMPFEHADQHILVGVTIGMSLYPNDGDDLAHLLRKADQALYRRKRTAKNGWEWYGQYAALS